MKKYPDYKKKLFTTEDGVDIFDTATRVYEVLLSNNFHLNKNMPFSLSNKFFANSIESLIFFYEEKAQEYIDLMKPKYSKKDIIDLLDKYLSKYKLIEHLNNG